MNLKHPVLEREERAYSRLSRMRQLIRDAYEFVLPNMKHDLDLPDGDAAPERVEVTDSTATEAAFAYADRFMTRYMPPNERFIGLAPGVAFEFFEAAGLDDVRELLDQVVELNHRLLEISNFHETAHSALLDYAISTGAFNFNERPNPNSPFNFELVPLPQLTPEEGPQGTAQTSFRRFKVLPQNIEATWPDAQIPQGMSYQMEQSPKEPVELVEALLWNGKTDRYDYVLVDRRQGHELVRRPVRRGARIMFRNMLSGGCPLGIGPALRQLPNIKQLNKDRELHSIVAERNAIEAYQAPMDHPLYSQGGLVDLAPGVVLPYRSNPLVPLVPGGDVRLTEAEIAELRSEIRRAFLDDSLPSIEGPVRSPTEFVSRERQNLERFEPAATRLDAELLRPLAMRSIDIMARQGLIPPLRVDGLRVKIVADGPLSRLRRQNEARARMVWAGELIQTFGAEVVFASTDVAEFTADLLEDGGVEPKFVLDRKEREEARQAAIDEQLALMEAETQITGRPPAQAA